MSRFKDKITFSTNNPLAAGANALVPMGRDGSLVFQTHEATRLPFLRFGFFADTTMRLDIEACTVGASFIIIDSITSTISTYRTAYNLTSPKGDTGIYQLQFPYLRLRLTNTNGGVAQTDLRFWAVLSNF